MPDYSHKWWALATVASGVFMATVDGSIVNIALKTIQDSFGADLGDIEWIVLGYLLVITCLLPSMGRLGDMIGKRRIYIAGFVVFTISSALCGLAWDVWSLVGFRVLQGVGAAMLQGVSAALLVAAFPPTERGQALGYIGTTVAVGVSTGPILGGFLLQWAGWPSIFYVNVPIGIAAVLLAQRALPDDTQRSTQRFDIPGALMLGGALLFFLLGMTEGQHIGFLEPLVIGLIVASIVGMGLFIWWERRVQAPMIDLSIFSNLMFSLSLAATFASFLSLSFNFLLLPFFLQSVLGFDPQRTGITLIASSIIISLVAPTSGRLSDQFGPRWLAVIGLSIAGCGLLLLSMLTPQSNQWDVIWRLLLIGLGFGLFQSPNNSAIMGAAPRSAMGVAGSLLAVMRTLGQTTGIALAGAIWVSQVAATAGRMYDPITSAPREALAAGFSYAMVVAAGLTLLGIASSLARGQVTAPPQQAGDAHAKR